MSIAFTLADDRYLRTDTPPVTAAPFTVSCLFYYTGGFNNDNNLFQIQDKDAANDYFRMHITDEASPSTLSVSIRDGGTFREAVTGNTLTANTWRHGCSIFAAADDRTIILDGDIGNAGTEINSSAPNNIDSMDIAREGDSSPGDNWIGNICEFAIWNVALGEPEVVSLSKGFSPLLVRPQSLVFYLPMVRDNYTDIIGGNTMTAVNSPIVAEHAPVIYPARQFISHPVAVAGFTPYPNPRYAMEGGMQPMNGGI